MRRTCDPDVLASRVEALAGGAVHAWVENNRGDQRLRRDLHHGVTLVFAATAEPHIACIVRPCAEELRTRPPPRHGLRDEGSLGSKGSCMRRLGPGVDESLLPALFSSACSWAGARQRQRKRVRAAPPLPGRPTARHHRFPQVRQLGTQ